MPELSRFFGIVMAVPAFDPAETGIGKMESGRMDMDYKLREVFEQQIANALAKAEANAKPQLQALLARLRAAKDSAEMTRLMTEAAALLNKAGDATSTMRGRWNAVKALFKK